MTTDLRTRLDTAATAYRANPTDETHAARQVVLGEIVQAHGRWVRGEPEGAGAYLAGAYLAGADLAGANLAGAYLAGAYLAGAYLAGADLAGANLARAYLAGADLAGANLAPIRDDVFAVLDSAPAEVPGLLLALREGRVDGTAYEGECACLVGTIANVRGCGYRSLAGLRPDPDRLAERWFLGVGRGQTPATSPLVAVTEGWIVEWLAARERAQAAGAPA